MIIAVGKTFNVISYDPVWAENQALRPNACLRDN